MSLMLNTGAMQYRIDGSSAWQPLTLVSSSNLIHVGPSEPSDPAVQLWFDTDEQGDTWPTNVVLRANARAITANGTTSGISLVGLTADHVVGNWGMFSDSSCTVPIPENSPTCDIEITTGSGSWSVTITNFTSSFYLRPTFILKRN